MIYTILIATCALACNNNSNQKKNPTTDIEVATAFIRSVLNNDFKNAEQYLLKDETNLGYFKSFEHHYQLKNEAELNKFKAADIIIDEIKPQSDSIHLITYTNTYENTIKNNLKLVWVNNLWLVDLKYTFAQNQ